jgi:hypothetical protein
MVAKKSLSISVVSCIIFRVSKIGNNLKISAWYHNKKKKKVRGVVMNHL